MAKNKNKLQIYDIESNIFSELSRGIYLGFINLWRNKLLTIATVLVMAIMICIFNSIVAVKLISQQALSEINQKVSMVIYIKDGTDFYEINSIIDKLKNQNGIKKIEYTSKDQALQQISKTYPETANFLTKFNLKNPLPASISIVTEKAENQKAIYQFLENSNFNQFIERNSANYTDEQAIISATTQNLISINNYVKQIIFWLVFIFIIGGTLIIINAIQLTIYTRRNEISIMRLVGATPNFIRLPFLTEGISYAAISVCLSFILIFIASKSFHIENLSLFVNNNSESLLSLFLGELGIAILLSLFSSLIAIEQYIHGKLIYQN